MSNYADYVRKTVLLHPAGSPMQVGRTIGTAFERGLTLQCAQALHAALEQYQSIYNLECMVIMSNKAGQVTTTFEHAQHANQLNVDLCITINMYADESSAPVMHLYQYSNNATPPIMLPQDIYFIPLDCAHNNAFKQSKKYAHHLYNCLVTDHRISLPHIPIACPYIPLMGITVPAIGIELGIKDDNWQLCIEPIAKAILRALRES